MKKAGSIIMITSVIAALTVSPVMPAADDRPVKLSHDELTGLLDFTPKTVFYGGCMIVEGQVLEGTVVVIAGSLDIQDGGILRGDAWIINGRLILTGKAVIDGNVRLVNSNEYSSREAVIKGDILCYRSEAKLDDTLFEEEGVVEFIKYTDPKEVRTKLTYIGESSGRVGYLSFGIGIKRENEHHKEPYVKGRSWISICPFKRSVNLFAFDAEYLVPIKGKKVELLFHAFSRPFTNDNWMISNRENGFIFLMTGDDFFDYWQRDGGETGLRLNCSDNMLLETLLSYQRESSLAAYPVMSILYPTDKYRVNPEIDEGNRLAVSAMFRFDARADEIWRENAWFAEIRAEKGIADGPGDFSYSAFEIDLRRYNFLPRGMRLDLRGRLFSSFTALPRQLSRSLNGYGGVRGLSDLPFVTGRGDRMSLFSIELRRRLPEVPLFKTIFSRWDLLFFSDIGILSVAENKEAPFRFLTASSDAWKKTVGAGISGESLLPYIGFYIAHDLDAERFQPRYILRFNRSF